MQSKLRAALGIILSFFMVTDSFALLGSNIGNEVTSARAAGQGYVGVAGQNNDPTAVYTNPGAMTSLKGTQATVGLHWENIHGAYQDNSGNTTKERVVNALVPNFDVTQSFLDGKLAAGLGVESPFGLESHWPGDSPLRYVATDSRLNLVQIMPVIAYQIHPMISIGAGVDYVNLFNAQLDRHVNVDALNAGLGAPTAGSADAVSSLRGQASNWGYHAGVVLQPHEKHAIGITYHSKVNLRVNGNLQLRNLSGTAAGLFGGSEYSTSAFTDLVLPQNVQLGYAFKPNDKWHFEVDAAWLHWSETQDLNVRYSETNPVRVAVLNTGNPELFNLRDAWSFSTGVNFKATDHLQLRSGFWYLPWAMPESTFTPALNDLSRYGLSVGTGYQLTENLTVDAAYNAIFFHNRTINNSVGATTSGIPNTGIPALGVPSADISGTYKDFANLISLNITYRFGGK